MPGTPSHSATSRTSNRTAADSGPTIVALSGGVDSAVAALLLRDAGHDVQCLHMTNWEDDGYCNAARDFHDARRVCQLLGVPLHRVNFAREYREHVFADFLAEYRKGRTPNPDVLCNREIKFGVMRRYAQRLGAARIATGHYARLGADDLGTPQLLKARDASKDQSYFLHGLGQDALADVLFPVGGLPKPEVRALAARAGLANAEKPESQEICFVTRGDAAEFVALRAPGRVRPGEIVSTSGEVLGRHAGVHGFTVGQRRGLGVAGTEPRYVVRLEPEAARVVIGTGAEASRARFRVAEVSWVAGAAPAEPRPVRVKVRHRHEGEEGTVSPIADGGAEVILAAPVRGVAPGQAAVFYDGDEVVGGGRIL